ncbi:MAG: DUF2142 domain-containing protein [Acidiferrobacterales bacterium]|nr:DUF2142 domain-containing protein [Acidiferrobacterales bacterium]
MSRRVFQVVFISTVLFVFSLAFYSYAAFNLPTLFNLDNQHNYAATRYIAEHHRLPVVDVDSTEVDFTEFGTTRSLRPPFTFIVSALVVNLTTQFTSDAKKVNSPYTTLRLGSALIGALTVVIFFTGFWIAFNHLGLAAFGALALGLLPKFVLLASSNNDDIGAIMSVSLLFTCTLALVRFGFKRRTLIALALSIGLVLQTKFTAWLALPWLCIFCLTRIKPDWQRALKLLPLCLAACLLSGGWWLVFNMVNYGLADPTALHYAADLQQTLTQSVPNRQGYASLGVGVFELLTNHDEFLDKSYRSFIGYLEWLDLEMSTSAYIFYAVIFLFGLIGVALLPKKNQKESAYFNYIVIAMIISQLIFYLHHNWLRDVQPQARYVLPILMPLMYLFLYFLNQIPQQAARLTIKNNEYKTQALLSGTLATCCLMCFYQSWVHHITPSYRILPYFTSVDTLKSIDLKQDVIIAASHSADYQYVDDALLINRTALDSSFLELDSQFCKLLPLNALLVVDVNSALSGSFEMQLDTGNKQRYDNIFFNSFPAGSSTAILTINTKNCTGARLSLSKNTHQLSLKNWRIAELKIHQYGKPI